jgi:hypothetical protein
LLVLVSVGRSTNVEVLDVDFMLLATNEVVYTRLFHGASTEERVATALAGPVIDDKVAVDVELQLLLASGP